jgi:hypothetical protein
VDPVFSTKADVPGYLKGRDLEGVALELQTGALSADDIPIQAFEHASGDLVSTNTRGLTVLSMAGMKPTNIIIREATKNEAKRLNETSVLGDRLPSSRIAITPSRLDKTVIRIVHISK